MKRLSDVFSLTIITGTIIVLTVFSPRASEGAKSGMKMCADIILPSLLCVLILSNTIIKSRLSALLEKPFGFVFERFFHLPRRVCPAVILGLTAGYPAGILMTLSLYKASEIDDKTALRLARFNFCGGAAFTVTAVGTVTLKSTKTGVALFLICIASSLTVAFIDGLFNRRSVYDNNVFSEEKLSVSEALPKAVEASVKSIAVMCAYIVLFSAFLSVAEPPKMLMPLIEITNGLCFQPSLPSLSYIAFFLSFGGFCIHFQLLGFLREIRVKYLDFFIGRTLCAFLSFIYTRLYLFVYPQQSEVFSTISQPSGFGFAQGGVSLGIIMIIGCAVLVFDIENRKLKLA